ncbi:MAG TPA: nitroreductase family protein [Candidatus Xenobia bacterium]|nr:nitroreductase family protein [Candidatus Xenobia bacterium]
MEERAATRAPIQELLARRWSPYAFSERPVAPEILVSLLEAARWAPSSYNEQPWAFLVATKENPEEFARLLSCLVPSNQEWARNAPVLMLSVAKLKFDRGGRANPHAWHDVGLAAMSLVVQAMAHGLYVHQMAGIEPERAREHYSIPEGWEAVAGIAIGYLGDSNALPEKLRQRDFAPRSRRPLEQMVFTGRWGQPTRLASRD